MYDVVIVGAGPAGATVARLIAERGLRVLLADRRRLDEPPGSGATKPCGGLLAPKAQKELARQGLGVPGRVVVGPQLFAVRTVDIPARLERLYQRFYVNVDREEFDRWLLSLVPGSVERVFGWSLAGLEPDDGDGVTCHFRTTLNGYASARTRLLVGADGGSSVVRRAAFGTHRMPPRYTCVQAAFENAGGEPHYGAIFDESLTDYYGWTIPKGDTLLVGAAFPAGPRAGEAFDRFVSQARGAGFRFGAELRREAAMVLRPDSPEQMQPGRGSVALVGEAAGFISASSSEGISYALRSARLLAGAMAPGLEGAVERYRLASAGLGMDVAFRMAKADAIYASGTRRLVMRSGLGAIGGKGREVAADPGF